MISPNPDGLFQPFADQRKNRPIADRGLTEFFVDRFTDSFQLDIIIFLQEFKLTLDDTPDFFELLLVAPRQFGNVLPQFLAVLGDFIAQAPFRPLLSLFQGFQTAFKANNTFLLPGKNQRQQDDNDER